MTECVLVYMTASSAAEAEQLATGLLDKGLVACVNIYPAMISMYRWQGRVQRDSEVALIAKTQRDQVAAVEAWIVQQHSYECPCVIALPIQAGHAPFLQWLTDQTQTAEQG